MSGQWGTPLFACMSDTPQCVDNCLCFPCQSSRQLRVLEGAANEFNPAYCCLACLVPACASAYIRWNVVQRYGIEEKPPVAILAGLCCAACSSCQVHRELTLRTAWPGGTFLHRQPGDYTQMQMR